MTVMVERKRKVKEAKCDSFQCGYCKRVFKRESSVASHKCADKEKYLAKDTKKGLVAMDMWVKFRKFYRIRIKQTDQLYDAFAESKECNSFLEFAEYILNNPVIKYDEFVEYLFRDGVPQRDWTTQKIRKQWILKCTRDEHPTSAMVRSVHTLQEWSTESGNDWNSFFETVSSARFLMLIESGRISPWLVHAASNRQLLLDRLSDEEFNYIYEYIDPAIWNVKKLKYKDDYNNICDALKAYGL